MAQKNQSSLWSTFLSIMLILLGFLFLLDTFNIIQDTSEIFLAAMFGVGSFVGISYYLQNRKHWWALIPSAALFGVASILASDVLRWRVEEGSFILFALALAFWIIFVTERKQRWAIIPALILSIVGVIVILRRPEFFLGLLFGTAFLFSLRYYLKNRNHWWVLFPGSALLGVSGILIMDSLRSAFGLRFLNEGSWMLLALSVGFWIVYIAHQKHWWAGIPAGILTSIGFMITIDSFTSGSFPASFLIIGFGLTFGMLWIRRKSDGTDWAIWPASALIGLGLFISVAEYFDTLWPLIFIAAGGWLLLKNFAQNRKSDTVKATPTSDVVSTDIPSDSSGPEPEPVIVETEE